jgi:SET domain-containing protein
MATYSLFKDTHEASRHELAFFSLDIIEAGTELTFDYSGWGGSRKADKYRPKEQVDKCMCGTTKCRGYVPLF